MSKETTKKLVDLILTRNRPAADSALQAIVDNKYQSALEAKKVSIASKIYSK